MHINIDTLGVCAYELANESVSKSELGGVTFDSEVVVIHLPGFIVFHLLTLEECLEREWANFEHGRTGFALVSLCPFRGKKPVPDSLLCPWSMRPSWTTAGFQDTCCDKGKVLCLLNFSFRKCNSSKSTAL